MLRDASDASKPLSNAMRIRTAHGDENTFNIDSITLKVCASASEGSYGGVTDMRHRAFGMMQQAEHTAPEPRSPRKKLYCSSREHSSGLWRKLFSWKAAEVVVHRCIALRIHCDERIPPHRSAPQLY